MPFMMRLRCAELILRPIPARIRSMKPNLHICISALLAAVLSAGCGNGGADAAKAASDFGAGRYASAARTLEKATSGDGGSATLYYNLGVAKAMAGDTDGAIRAFENAQSIDITATDAAEYRAHLLVESGDFDAAHEILDGLVTDTDEPLRQARVLSALAVCEHGMGRDDLAFLRLVRATSIDPSYAPAAQNFAKLREGRGDDVRPAQHKSSAEANGLVAKGTDAYARSKWQLAIESFEKALKADPKSYAAASALAAAHFAAHHYSDAAEAYELAATLDPTKFEPFYWQAYIAYSLGNPVKATKILCETVIPRWPDDARAYELASYAWATQKRFYEARMFGDEFLRRAKTAGTDTAAFVKWFNPLPQIAFEK